jgi:putative ABC transport system permease protein
MNFFTELREGLATSWSAIRANKLRSVLTTLGIVIGVVTVTLMGTAIAGINRAFVESISSFGADVLFVSRNSWFIMSEKQWLEEQKRPRVTLAEAGVLENQMQLAGAVAPVAEMNEPVKYSRRNASNVSILGTTEQYLFTSGLNLGDGRFISQAECDGGRPVCVIGYEVATNLFQNGEPVGQDVLINQRAFEVVGVLAKHGGFADDSSADNQIIVPLAEFTYAFWRNPDYSIQVKVKNLGELDDAQEELRGVLRRYRRLAPDEPDNFSIGQQEQFLELFHKVAGTIAAIGLFITGLSLFVGGIGIMNIMFVSVAERTREIGVRKAIGAKRRTILLQFLIEAACICLIGGIIALLIAWPVTWLMQKAMPAELSPAVIGLALLVAVLTGLLSGFFPAWRAARMNPVDALRNE